MSQPIICFGEALWDCLPDGREPGGAPMNVAYHLHRLGRRALPVTAVGDDAEGDELLGRLRSWGLDTIYVAVLGSFPTGRVEVTLDEKGSADYEIVEGVAWDHIPVPDDLEDAIAGAAGIVFGSLAQRSSWNLRRLLRLLSRDGAAMKIFDVNLRPPFDSIDLVRQLAGHADLIKLNTYELARLLEDGASGDLEKRTRKFAGQIGCGRICVTDGADGAGLLLDDRWHREKARPVEVRDTVGAGDAFLAALVHGLLADDISPAETLARACRLGEFVAGSTGATPSYTISADGRIIRGG